MSNISWIRVTGYFFVVRGIRIGSSPVAVFCYPDIKRLTPPALRAGGVIYRTKIWHRAILPGPCGPSIVAAVGLNFRVRNGNGWIPHAIGARNC